MFQWNWCGWNLWRWNDQSLTKCNITLTERRNSWVLRSSLRMVIASTWKKLLTRIIVFVFECWPGIDTRNYRDFPVDAKFFGKSFAIHTGRIQSLFIAFHTLTSIRWWWNVMMRANNGWMIKSSDWMFHCDLLNDWNKIPRSRRYRKTSLTMQ